MMHDLIRSIIDLLTNYHFRLLKKSKKVAMINIRDNSRIDTKDFRMFCDILEKTRCRLVDTSMKHCTALTQGYTLQLHLIK